MPSKLVHHRWLYGCCLGGALLTGLWLAGPAQAERSINDLELWAPVTLEVPVSEKFSVFLEAQTRLGDHLRRIDRFRLRTAVFFRPVKAVAVGQGYVWAPNFQRLNLREGEFEQDFRNEHRLFQQLDINHPGPGRLEITHRTRFEQRFIEGAGDVSLRVRHRLQGVYPLGKTGKWALVASEELFFNLNDTPSGPAAGFDQSRAYAGVRRQLGPAMRADAGYSLNARNSPGPNNRLNHILFVGLDIETR